LALVWLASSFRTKRAVKAESLASGIVHRLPVIAGYVLLFGGFSLGPLDVRIVPATVVWILLGVILTLAGILCAILARFTLGRNWSAIVTLKQDHELIQSGLYKVVRHPIYSSFLLAMLGTAVAFGRLRDFLALLLATLGWKIKSLGEERFMRNQFGDQYAEYMGRVKGLIPFVW
jgi:protein-S-isoprenylcysteine O-methyltransferase